MTQEQPSTPDSNEPNSQASEAQEPVLPDESLPATSEQAIPPGDPEAGAAEASSQSDELASSDESRSREFLGNEATSISEPAIVSAPTPLSPSKAQPSPTTLSRDVQSQTLRSLQQFWQDAQPILKVGTIRTLKGTIRFLEIVVARLEAEPKSQDVTPTPETSSTPVSKSVRRKTNLLSTVQQGWQRFWAWWNTVLPKIREILPVSVHERLSDRALTGAIVGLLVIVLWTTSSLFSSKPPTQVATAPPSKSTPAKPTTQTKAKEPPKAKQVPDIKVVPSPTPTPVSQPSPSPQVSPQPTPSPLAKSPEFPVPTPTPIPKPSPPPPPLKLTPEQKLIARIQDQVAEASDQSVSGLIQSVQANFRSSRLTVKVSSQWSSLLEAQQSKIANDVLKRTQQLNFVKLEIVDSQGTLLARSPVVGSEMVILKPTVAHQDKADRVDS